MSCRIPLSLQHCNVIRKKHSSKKYKSTLRILSRMFKFILICVKKNDISRIVSSLNSLVPISGVAPIFKIQIILSFQLRMFKLINYRKSVDTLMDF